MENHEHFSRLYASLNYRFQNLDLIQRAFVHRSATRDRLAMNETFEFVGDAVLGLVMAAHLESLHPLLREGTLTRMKSELVSSESCAAVAFGLDLGQYLQIGSGLDRLNAKAFSRVMADTCEAVIGAVFKDGGYAAARAVILHMFATRLDDIANRKSYQHPKETLLKSAQRRFGAQPRYVLLGVRGPEHAKEFQVAVEINGELFPSGWGSSLQEAQCRAAELALDELTRRDALRAAA